DEDTVRFVVVLGGRDVRGAEPLSQRVVQILRRTVEAVLLGDAQHLLERLVSGFLHLGAELRVLADVIQEGLGFFYRHSILLRRRMSSFVDRSEWLPGCQPNPSCLAMSGSRSMARAGGTYSVLMRETAHEGRSSSAVLRMTGSQTGKLAAS